MKDQEAELIQNAIHGVAEVTRGDRGLRVHRLRSNYAMHHENDPLTQKVADQASGARLVFETLATRIEFGFRATGDKSIDGSFVSAPTTVNLTYAGKKLLFSHANPDRRVWSGNAVTHIETGEDAFAIFELEETIEPRMVELWLPHNSDIEILSLSADAPLEAAKVLAPKWVHYGSSISHCMEADEPLGVWPVVAARELDLDLFSLGLAGSANIEQFAARAIAELPADFISLKLGINPVGGRNMTRRTFVPAVHAFLDTVRAAHPETPIVLISPVICEALEDAPGPSGGGLDGKVKASEHRAEDWVGDLTLTMVREILEAAVARREDPNLAYLNGLELFGQEDVGLMPDGLHPNAEGYRLIGERFAKIAKEREYLR